MSANFDRADIMQSYQLFHDPGDVVELRIPKAGKSKTISGYYKDAGSFADAVVGLADEEFQGYYFTINQVKPELHARAANTYKRYADSTTSDNDILRRRWLPIDLDAKRPAGISSSEEEHSAALQLTREIRSHLISKGWPENAFILGNSGNGGHLDVKIDLPNDEGARDLIQRCLEALDSIFSNDKAKVDTATYNAARIWKIYGTMARKGSNTADRPHRLAKILEAPAELVTVPREFLEELASTLPRPEPTKGNDQTFDPVKYAESNGAKVAKIKHGWVDPKGKKWTLAILEECPFNPEHNRGEAWVGVADNGERGFGCPHDGCQGNDWHALRALWGPPKELWEATSEEAEALTEAILEERGLTISEEELDAFKLPDGPKFECKLPNDHFIQRFIAYGTEISDAYPDYWMAGALYALAVVADKKIKVVLRQGTVYPNLYVSINGKSSLARKSTAVDKTEEMLLKVLHPLLPTLVPTEFSPEAFIEHLSNFQHAPWIRDEAAGVLSLMKKDYMRGFKDSLMQLFDCKPFHRKLRTSQRKGSQTDFNVDDPYLNLLWATTDASLGANTDQNDTLSGFLARFIFFFPQGMKPRFMPLEEGTAAISIFEDVIVLQLRGIVTKISEIPECAALHISPEAAAYYNPWQETREREWTASNDGAAMQIFSRLNPMVVKLGMLFELGAADFDPARPIRLEFIEEACRLVDEYLMPTARAIYDIVGANAEKNVIDRIIAYLKNHGGKATRKEIMRDVKIKSADFNEYLATMIESDTVETKTVKRSGKGRDSVYVFLLPQTKVGNVTNVAKIAKVTKVEKIQPKCSESDESTLATLTTKPTLPIVATIEDQLKQAEDAAKAKEAQFKTPIKCTSCGKDITNKTQLTKNGKTYCRDCGDLSEPKPCGSCAVALRGDKSAIKCDPCIYLGRATA